MKYTSCIIGLLLCLALALPAYAQLDWQSQQTTQCFEQWISETEQRLNTYSGTPAFNDNKPWRISRYGLAFGRNGRSAYEPDDWWTVYRANKYRRMWDKYDYDLIVGWSNSNWDGAGVPELQSYVNGCLAENRSGFSGGGINRSAGPYVWVFTGASPMTVSVADGNWPSGNAAWTTVAGPFRDHPSAWRVACQYHRRSGYSAPAIVAGNIDCAALGGSAGRTRRTDYVRLANVAIYGSNIGSYLTNVTVNDCKAACDREGRCLSFDYKKPTRSCVLNRSSTSKGTRTTRDGNYDLYEKPEGRLPTRVTPSRYTRTTNVAISYHNIGSYLTNVTVNDCKAACDRNDKCRSFDFKKPTRSCVLNSTNARRVAPTRNSNYDLYEKQ